MGFTAILDDLLGISHLTTPKKTLTKEKVSKKIPKQDFEKVFTEFFGSAYDGVNITAIIDGKICVLPKEVMIAQLKKTQENAKKTHSESIVIQTVQGTNTDGWCCTIDNYNNKVFREDCWDYTMIYTPMVFKHYMEEHQI